MDALILSRLQFGLNISFHILFPTITIALGWYLFYFKLRSDMSGHPVWMRIYRFWVRVFALTFALGVVSGVTMSFQFGTNWPGFMETVGNVAGPLLGYEVLTAFFLEATFLGIMLFGIRRVPNWLHTLSTLIVAVGTTLSAFWILALNSWMQTPQGHEVIEGIAYARDWSAIIFNPSFPYRLSHTLLASGLTASFLIAGLSAYRTLKGDNKLAPKIAIKTATYTASILIPLQIFAGDLHGLNTLEHQPQKVAAMEGIWETRQGVPLLLFAIPDEAKRTNHWELPVPNGASLILTHHMNGEIKGLNEFRGQHPPVAPVFFSFRIMVGMGMLMLLVAWAGSVYLLKQKPMPVWMLKWLALMTFSGWIATLAGWYVTEVGRQPYLVSGVLKTADAVTQIPPENVGLSFSLYLLLYLFLLVSYITTLRLICQRAVNIEEISDEERLSAQPARVEGMPPLSDKGADNAI
ncbi:cytochrome ubiquinol oxidase subunit I [Alteromonas aestuariivivens]|uniref:Cytochrome ubiquinol oxidase subunit I n=1 Tax=Alteromonas aestuariivivens TaxID=1938339 RepID=A0A3D8M9Z6_9ALTE|nr:cytochrome ubiquinol oxidase subunit I [Alteromonas aestuariivivens]RDV26615.1 cytochrome ubiquinol oxidase subunit I [Alteromonas aestuariivivens]